MKNIKKKFKSNPLLLLLLFLSISGYSQKEFSVRLKFDKKVDVTKVKVSFNNGLYEKNVDIKNNYFIEMRDSFFAKYATIYLNIDSNHNILPVRKKIYINKNKSTILIKLNRDNTNYQINIKGGYDCSTIESEYRNFVKTEEINIENLNRSLDTLSSERRYILNEAIRKELINKQILFIKKHSTNYYSFSKFKYFVAPSIFSDPVQNEEIFNTIFPKDFTETVEGNALLELIKGRKLAASEGAKCPLFVTELSNGKYFNSKELNEKYLLVNIWATWCVPCIAELPSIKQIFENVDSSKLQILSISIDADSIKYIKGILKYGMLWNNVLNDKNLITKLGGAVEVPQLFLFNQNGVLIYNRNYRKDTDSKLPILNKILKENMLLK